MPDEFRSPKFGQRSRQDVLQPEEQRDMLAACRTMREQFIVSTLMYGGLRVGELVHMTRHWVDFDNDTLTVPATQRCSCTGCREQRSGVWKPKTPSGARTIRIHPRLRRVLEMWFHQHESLGIRRHRTWRIVKDIARRTYVGHNVYPHCLRATCATDLTRHNISAASLRYNLGWSNLASAESYVQSDQRRAAAETQEIYQRV